MVALDGFRCRFVGQQAEGIGSETAWQDSGTHLILFERLTSLMRFVTFRRRILVRLCLGWHSPAQPWVRGRAC